MRGVLSFSFIREIPLFHEVIFFLCFKPYFKGGCLVITVFFTDAATNVFAPQDHNPFLQILQNKICAMILAKNFSSIASLRKDLFVLKVSQNL